MSDFEIRQRLLDFIDSYGRESDRLYQQGRYADAIERLTSVVDKTRRHLASCDSCEADRYLNFRYYLKLNDLASLHIKVGDYAAALPVIEQGEEVCRRVLGGEEEPLYVATLSNLAMLYLHMGDSAAALRPVEQLRDICRKQVGEDDPIYAECLCSAAAVYAEMAEYAAALPLLGEALEIRRKRLGEESVEYASTLTGMAAVYMAMGDCTAGLRPLKLAREIYRKRLGEWHPDYALVLTNLGTLHVWRREFAEAQPLFRQAREIRRRTLGEEHPYNAISLNCLAGLYEAMGDYTTAVQFLQQSIAIQDRELGQIFSFGSESQRLTYLQSIQHSLFSFLSLVSRHLSASPPAVGAALDTVLRRKAVAAEALATQRDSVLGGRYPGLKPQLQELSSLRMQIARTTIAGPGAEGEDGHRATLNDWNRRKERLETELARRIPEMHLEQKLRIANRQAVALALPDESALVEIVRFDVFETDAHAGSKPGWGPPRYLAFVLLAGEPDNMRMIDLGEAEPIDRMIATFRAALTEEDDGRAADVPAAERGYQGARAASERDGSALRAALFDKLSGAMGQRKRLLIAPDGDICLLPFEVLPTTDGRRLIDEYRISYLSVGRDVLRIGVPSTGQPSPPLVVADPDFDLASEVADDLRPQKQATSRRAHERPPQPRAGFWAGLFGRRKPDTSSPTDSVGREGPSPPAGRGRGAASRLSRDMSRSRLYFGRLPATQVEGRRIAELLRVEPHLGASALESRIKSCRSPGILHLATHGLFLPDQNRDQNKGRHDLPAGGIQPANGAGRLSGPGLENPMLRSGLALAGVNTWLREGDVPAEAEDGFLTAEEVSGLDLLATELVVLSACETGLGEVRVGEGVFGLRRAFVLAGAKTLVMSLWKVPDLSTAILMERFYENLLVREMARDEALRDAQFYTRDITVGELRGRWLGDELVEQLGAGNDWYVRHLAAEPDDHRPFTHPLHWGAFICQGDFRPLRWRQSRPRRYLLKEKFLQRVAPRKTCL